MSVEHFCEHFISQMFDHYTGYQPENCYNTADVVLMPPSLMKTSAKASHFPNEQTSFFHSGEKKKDSTVVIMKVNDMDGTGPKDGEDRGAGANYCE